MVKARVMSGHAIHGKAKTQAPWNVGFRINDGGRVVAGFGYKGFDQRAQECVPRPLQDGLGGSVLGGDLTHERHGGSCGRHADLVWFGCWFVFAFVFYETLVDFSCFVWVWCVSRFVLLPFSLSRSVVDMRS